MKDRPPMAGTCMMTRVKTGMSSSLRRVEAKIMLPRFNPVLTIILAVYSFRLIPSDPTAIEVGLSHASRTTGTMSGSGILLSNT